MSHLAQAMHDLVHKSKIKSVKIAEALGFNHQILINKVNPHNTVNKLTVHELHGIQILTGNDVVLRAMQAELVLSVMKGAPCSIMEAMIHQGKEIGDIFAVVQDALADNRLTELERSNILKEVREGIAALMQLESAVLAHGRA